jgi:hypothetical protein
MATTRNHTGFLVVLKPPNTKIRYLAQKTKIMETPTKKPMTGIEIVRKLVEVQQQAKRDAVYNYQNDPEIRAIVEKLKEKNGKRKAD